MKKAIYRTDDNELLGFAAPHESGWHALTIFGIPFAQGQTEADATAIVRNKGLEVLMGRWEYFDAADKDWHPCLIKEAGPSRVVILTTDEYGHPDPQHSRQIVLQHPDSSMLHKP